MDHTPGEILPRSAAVPASLPPRTAAGLPPGVPLAMILQQLLEFLVEPKLLAREIRRRIPCSFEKKLRWDAVPRPPYAYGAYHAALQARSLGLDAISAIEFGVAGGNGLVDLERTSAVIAAEVGVRVDIYGFDRVEGLPPPTDYRDMPYKWRSGQYRMDVMKLEARLEAAELVLGPVSETVPRFFEARQIAPIGFVAFDLDYYSSTRDALTLFDAGPAFFLPRVYCYFDDCIGSDRSLHSRYTGELLAIEEFNEKHADRKIAKIHGFAYKRRIPSAWNEKMYAFHYFSHPRYSEYVGPARDPQLELES